MYQELSEGVSICCQMNNIYSALNHGNNKFLFVEMAMSVLNWTYTLRWVG
jgi:hypothetical protein